MLRYADAGLSTFDRADPSTTHGSAAHRTSRATGIASTADLLICSEAFEIAAKFCYGVKIDPSSSNVVPLHCAGEYLDMMEEAVRSVEMKGLFWGASKLVSVGYGIKRLQIILTIVNDLVSIDDLIKRAAYC